MYNASQRKNKNNSILKIMERTYLVIFIILIFICIISLIINYFVKRKNNIEKEKSENNKLLKTHNSVLINSVIFCENPMELADNEIIFCSETGMYYKKTGNTFTPLISDKNHQIMLNKFGIERTLDIVKVNVSMTIYNGNIRDIYCYHISWDILNKFNINN